MTLRYIWAKVLKKMRGAAVYNSTVDKTSKVESGSQVVNSTMGKHSFCGYNCQILNCEIGSFCSIAGGVVIGGGKHPMDWVSMSPVFYSGRDSVTSKFSEHEREKPLRTIIGHDVWIGENVLIKQGVRIGTGAVVGMGSVVTKDIPPYMVYAGNPARKIRARFPPELTDELLKSEWWLIPEKRLLELGHLVTSPVDFIKAIKH